MRLEDVLEADWRPALGCTEPATVAWAMATAAHEARGEIEEAVVRCDPRMFKNCFAVGIPRAGGRSGIVWAAAFGALLPQPELGLEILRGLDEEIIREAEFLVASRRIRAEVLDELGELFVDCTVFGSVGTGRAVVSGEHGHMTLVERDGVAVHMAEKAESAADTAAVRARLAGMRLEDLVALARRPSPEARERLRRGAEMNLAICRHGLGLLPAGFLEAAGGDRLGRIGRLVYAGVSARMHGEEMVVMTAGGSGNKGITCSVPILLWGRELGASEDRIDEALALSVVVTSAATHYLGALSAVCGSSNAAGLGVAAGLVWLEGGGVDEISGALTNMVGNVSGMICDGAKIGCGLKALTAVDAAARCARLARAGVVIPPTDGIVGARGDDSLANLGRLAQGGGPALDREIIGIMRAKLG